MPAPSNAPQNHHQQATAPKWIPNQDEQDDLDAIDSAFKRLRKITGEDPYILTIPQDVQYPHKYVHRGPIPAYAYCTNTPFDQSEREDLQYQTFHFHEQGKEMYVLEKSSPDEPIPTSSANTKGRPGTGANTPSDGVKKTISFAAYKNKQNGGATKLDQNAAKSSDARAKQGAVKGPIERVKESEEMLAAVAEPEDAVPAVNGNSSASKPQKDLKRKREDERPDQKKEPEKGVQNGSAPTKSQQEPETNGTEPLAKKTKVTAEKPAKSQDEADEKVNQPTSKTSQMENTSDKGMPPRLSPGMPPRLSPGMPDKLSPLHKFQDSGATQQGDTEIPALPSRLSPTLPDNIAKSLEARASAKTSPLPSHPSAPASASKEKDDRLTGLKKMDGVTKHKSPIPRNGFRANSSSPAVRSDAEQRPADATVRAKSPERPSKDRTLVSKAPTEPKPHSQAKEALIVKIKFRKQKRVDLQRMLRQRPTPDKSLQAYETTLDEPRAQAKAGDRRNGEHKDANPVKGVAQKVSAAKKQQQQQQQGPSKMDETALATGKRPMPVPDDDVETPAAKRKKTEASDVRKAPSTPAQREVDSPLAPKSAQQATPGARKDLLSAAMRREQSQDSNGAHSTPQARSSTPMVNGTGSSNGARAPSSQPSNQTPKQKAWETDRKRLEALGRELKHAASDHLKAAGNAAAGSKEQRLAAIVGLESFICYFLAFTCADEAALSADPKQTPSYTLWRSLHGLYGFVKRNAEAYPPLCGMACSLGIVFYAHILSLATQYPADGPSRETLLDTQAHMQRAANEVDMKFDCDAWPEAFPKAWKGRSKTMPPKDKLTEPGKLEGQYKLPISMTTSPLRAARAGHAMLQEWIEKEKLDYTLRVKL